MRVLFDHGTPAPLRKLLGEHAVDLARERGWETRTNGDLLDLAEAEGYRALISTDKGIPHQQKLRWGRPQTPEQLGPLQSPGQPMEDDTR